MTRSRQAGMTLLEVLVAVAIFATAGMALMKTASEHLRGTQLVEHTTFATWVANNRLTRLHLQKRYPPKNNAKGEMRLADQDFIWQQRVTKATDNSVNVEVLVFHKAEPDNPITSVQTFIYQPTEAK